MREEALLRDEMKKHCFEVRRERVGMGEYYDRMWE
jgi:hypothetical protein